MNEVIMRLLINAIQRSDLKPANRDNFREANAKLIVVILFTLKYATTCFMPCKIN